MRADTQALEAGKYPQNTQHNHATRVGLPFTSNNKTNKTSFFQHTWQQRFTTSFHETQLLINNLSAIKTIDP